MTTEEIAVSTTLDEIIRHGRRPVLFENAIEDWPARHWKPRDLATFLGDKTFKCKVAARHTDEIQWETSCFHLEASFSQFVDWLENGPLGNSPFASLDRDKFSVYVDYKYMAEMFADQPHLLKAVDWGVLGLPGRGGEASTLWLGSAGTSTPCHQDCYGFNLVAQLYGRKRWVLFPPSNKLYPTRVPFEESSIFSAVNIARPDLAKHPDFKEATPVVVELRPGQALYVPRHWWHYVESLEPSISVNTWVEMEADDEERVREAIVRTLVSGLVTGVDSDSLPLTQLLNPNETLLPMASNLQYLDQTLRVVCQCQSRQTTLGNCALLKPRQELSSISSVTAAKTVPESQGKTSPREETGLEADCNPGNAHFGDCCKQVSNLERFAATFKYLPVKFKASVQELFPEKRSGTAKQGNPQMTGMLERAMSIDSLSEDHADEAGMKTSGISDDERWKGIFDEGENLSSKRERSFLSRTSSSRNGKKTPLCKDVEGEGNLKRKLGSQDGDHHPDCKMLKLEECKTTSTGKHSVAEGQGLTGGHSGECQVTELWHWHWKKGAEDE